MSEVTKFVYATRKKLRYPSTRGELTTEQLWDVPLTSRDDFNLDTIAKSMNRAVKAAGEESFVQTTTKTALQEMLEISLEVIKYVIATKQEELEVAKKRAARIEEKRELLALLAEKQKGELSTLTKAELTKRIEELGEG